EVGSGVPRPATGAEGPGVLNQHRRPLIRRGELERPIDVLDPRPHVQVLRAFCGCEVHPYRGGAQRLRFSRRSTRGFRELESLGVVEGQEVRVVCDALADDLLDPLCYVPVFLGALRAWDLAVRDVTNQQVRERKLSLAL